MIAIHLVLVILALICFLVAASVQASVSRVNLIAVGLFLWLLSTEVTGMVK